VHSLSDNELSNTLKTYLIACKVEEKSNLTLGTYSDRINALFKFIQDNDIPLRIDSLTTSHIRLFLLSMRERGLAASTLNAYYRALNTFFVWLVAEGINSSNPMHNIKPPRVPKQTVKPFSDSDISRLLKLTADSKFLQVRNRVMILLFLDTGIRLAESAGIQLPDIDFDHETIRIWGKGSKERLVPMGQTTQRALLKYLLMRRDEFPCLWVNEERRPLTHRGVQITIKKLCHRAEITDARPGPHTFRHTFAITYLRNGGDLFTLQVQMGHSTLEMTRRYLSSLGIEDVKAAHKKASPVDSMRL